jgi:hypothetical protein
MSKPTIFISSSIEGSEIARELALQLEPLTTPILWSEGAFQPGKTVIDSLTELADRADFAIFVLTADDVVFSRKASSRKSSLNVVFEIGFLAGRIGLPRTFIIGADLEYVALPSDLAGVMYIALPTQRASDLRATIAPAAAAIRKVIAEVGSRAERSSEFFSCFISYSWSDKDFAARLHDDLQKVGVRCWLDAKEIRVGDRAPEHIDRAIQAHDKLLLVLSNASIRSAWVRAEIRKAFELEHARRSTVLFPVRLDDAVFASEDAAEITQLGDRFIIDFSGWQDQTQYQRAFSRLVRDLSISASVESERRE